MTVDRPSPWTVRLSDLPSPVKLLFSAVLLTFGMGYLFAIANVALAVGWTRVQIVEHYWGDPGVRDAFDAEAAGGGVSDQVEEMSFDDLDADVMASAPAMSIPSFDSLVAEGHFHMFGFAMIFFICGWIISFADLSVRLKSTLILAPFIGSVFDIWSTILTRFVGPEFSWMMIVSGSLMATSFAAVFFISMRQMWFTKNPRGTRI